MKKIHIVSLLTLLIIPFTSNVLFAQHAPVEPINETKVIVWEGDPIHLEIPLGHERRIDFPEPIIEFNIKPDQAQLSEYMLTPQGTLLWKPKAAYSSLRTRAISMTGTYYIIDFSSKNDLNFGSTQTVKLVDPITSRLHNPKPTSTNSQSIANSKPPKAALPQQIPDFLIKNKAKNTPDYVEMSRFAMSHYTGAERLIPDVKATVINAPNPPHKWIRVFGDRIATKTLRSWKINKHYVTAILLRNKSHMPLEFDPRAIRGNFVYSATMNPLIQPKGVVGDEALLVVISTKPFREAIKD